MPASKGTTRPFATYYYDSNRGNPTYKDYSRIGRSSTSKGALNAAHSRIVDGEFPLAVIEYEGMPVGKISRAVSGVVSTTLDKHMEAALNKKKKTSLETRRNIVAFPRRMRK